MNMKTLRFAAERIVLAAGTLWIISLFAFVIIQLPKGDVIDAARIRLANSEFWEYVANEERDTLRGYFGLKRPLLWQYGDWIYGVVFKIDVGPRPHYDVERSSDFKERVLYRRLAFTLALLAFTSTLIWFSSIPIGVYSAVRRRSGDRALTLFRSVGMNVPDFLLALLLAYFLFAFFGWNVGGLLSPEYVNTPWNVWSVSKLVDMLQHLIVPGIALGAAGVARQSCLLRDALLEELGKHYVAAARARGVPEWKLIAKYSFPAASVRLIGGFRSLLPTMIGGSVIVSVVMDQPTLGWWMVHEIVHEGPDMYLYGAIFLAFCALAVVGAFVCDIALSAVDPHARLKGRATR